ncbi:MAG TPA: ECF-type sigma factor [Blastocatellia bacterium]|jgi:RNA polymerase sigma-70 factor, ECF subfamily
MPDSTPSQFSILLAEARQGSGQAWDDLILLIYQDLRRIAQACLKHEQPSPSLQATALVHEAYLRLFGEVQVEWQSQSHFLIVAARQMRRILIDRARTNNAAKRNGQKHAIPLEDALLFPSLSDPDLVALNDALHELEKIRPRASQVVELRFFAGLTLEEAAQLLGISTNTAKREWNFAKAWLYDQLRAQS